MRVTIVSRPDDAPGYQLRVAGQLQALLPDVEILEDDVSTADLVLVLIGPAWAASPPDADTVAKVAAALRANRRVVPATVQEGRIPPAASLPERIRPLAVLQAAALHHASFAADVAEMMREVLGGEPEPWRDGGPSGTLQIVSKDPGLVRRMFGRAVDWERQPVNVKVDGTVLGVMHLFGDDLTLPLTPGKHEILLRDRFEDPVEVVVPANGRVTLHVERSVLTGGITVKSRES